MTQRYFIPDEKGIEQLLSSTAMQTAVTGLAENVASALRAERPDLDVLVQNFEFTPTKRAKGRRAASSVWVLHPAAKRMQAADGIMTRAAAQAGLEVTDKT